jgi:D-xylose 1-dehydrogenase (NADP+, D-xylono-1,5-lactone-forming)
MAGSRQLTWGLLSTARINRAVIEPLQASKTNKLLAVASRSTDRAADYAKKWGIPHYYGSYEELLADPAIDVIYISLPNSLHAQWSIKAMQMGKHVLCEKPLATNVSDVDKLIEVSRSTGRVITEAFMYRHHPQTLKIKDMIDQGEIGKLQLIRGSFCYTNTRPDNPRLDLELGGGSLWDVGCYPISYGRYLTGEEPVELFGEQITGPTGIDLLFAGQLKFPSGVILQFECSFITPYKALMEITGDKGRIIIPEPYKPGKKTKILIDRGGKTHPVNLRGEELYLGEIEDLQNAVMNGVSPRISLENSRRNIVTIEGLYQSAEQSSRISL